MNNYSTGSDTKIYDNSQSSLGIGLEFGEEEEQLFVETRRKKLTKTILRNFRMEVHNMFHIYNTNYADTVPNIKNWLGR